MAKAWDKGITPSEFREVPLSDLNFIMEFKSAVDEVREYKALEEEHKRKIENVQREMMNNGRSR